MNDPEDRYMTLPSGEKRRLPFRSSDFRVGLVVGEGIVQRWIFDLHGEGFEDSDRIDGDYVLLKVPVDSIPDSEWEIDDVKAAVYASKPGQFPPVVLDGELSFIDGGHRHRAAQIRGEKHILAFVPVSAAARLTPN